MKLVKTEPAFGYGLRVGGKQAIPYVAYVFAKDCEEIEAVISAPYHKVVRVVILTEADYTRLKRAAARAEKEAAR